MTQEVIIEGFLKKGMNFYKTHLTELESRNNQLPPPPSMSEKEGGQYMCSTELFRF